jgi:uncharacterized membrane protein (UPF0127 family)
MTTACQLVDAETGAVVVENLEIADTFWSRFKGLQFRRQLPPNTGLLLIPCSSIHTFWMRFAIDVAYLDKQGQVLDVRTNLRPWRIVWPPRGAYAILEMNAGAMTVQQHSNLRVRTTDSPQSTQPYFNSI